MSTETGQESDSIVEIGGLLVKPGDRIGPYVYRRLVGRGGMALVLLGDDPDGNPEALKVLKAAKVDSGLGRFRREFRALARLRHPNVIRVDAYGDIHGHPYIAMEYVEGNDLHRLIHDLKREPPEKRWRRCEAVLVDLCRALAYIHRRGLVHRDLKPSNVLVDKQGRCKLTDFGIVKDLDPAQDSQVSTTLVGTWAYSSPEQVAGAPIDHRSDLYSLGVILFAMLTGRRPFVAKDLPGYLELHRTHQAPAPRQVDPAVPAHLDEICRLLMRKQPRERYRSAQEVLYRLEQLDDQVQPAEIGPWVPPLVGRDEILAALDNRVAALTRGEGGLVLVEGPPGSGRSRIVEHVAAQAAAVGLAVHRERVAGRDGALGPVLRLASGAARILEDRVPRDLAAAVRKTALEGAGPSGPGQLRAAFVQAFRTLLEDGPQLIVVDDLHHAQVASLDALLDLARDLDGTATLVVYACRADARGGRFDSLRASAARITLGPLSPVAVGHLCADLVGPGRSSQSLGERLHRETEGNPQFVVHYLHNLVAAGLVARLGTGWRLVADIEEVAAGYLEVPPAVRAAVHERLSGLDAEERELVEVLAVAGREVEVDVVMDLLDLDEDIEGDLVEGLCGCGILRRRRAGAESWLSFAHAKIGEVVYRDLDVERRADLHRRIAAVLELRYTHAPQVAAVVGQHYRHAGEAGKAFGLLAQAAARARDRGGLAEASELVESALQAEDAARVDLGVDEFLAVKRHVLETKGDVHALRGQWPEAKEALELAIALADQAEAELPALRLRMRLAKVLRNAGDLDAAEQTVSTGLPRARELHDREAITEAITVQASLAWSRGDLDRCEVLAQEGLVLATGAGSRRTRANLLLAATAVQASRGQLASAAAGLGECQAIFAELRMPNPRAVALANLAEVTLAQGEPALASRHGTESLEAARAAGHPVAEEAAIRIRGQCALAAGAAAEAIAELGEALKRAESLGMGSEVVACRVHLARATLLAGDPRGALAVLEQAAADARQGDPEQHAALIDTLHAQALARAGDVATARVALARSESVLATLPVLRRVQVTLELARGYADAGDPGSALVHAHAAARQAALRGFRLLGLEALLLAARYTTDEMEQERLGGEAQDGLAALAATLPPGWRAPFARAYAR